MRHVYECQMRRADRHGDTVSNVAFVDYMQEARLDLLRHHDTSPTPNPGEGLVVVNTVVDYLAPLHIEQAPLYVAVWATQVRAASFSLGYELFTGQGAEQIVHGRATTLLTPYVFTAGRPRRMTHEEREMLSESLGPSPVSDRPAPRGEDAWVGQERGAVVERPVHVRFSDVDLLGHVNNLRYLDYAQIAQVDLLTGVFREARVNGSVHTVIVRSETDYVGQMNLRTEPYAVRSRVVAVSGHSVSFEQEIRDDERVMARSRLVEVNVDDDGRPLAWHPRHRELFEQRCSDAATPRRTS
ncbi:MAG: thioesterase family protein [Nocardioides sp.]